VQEAKPMVGAASSGEGGLGEESEGFSTWCPYGARVRTIIFGVFHYKQWLLRDTPFAQFASLHTLS